MNREALGWVSRGNAKSAGTGDMPIPGVITSRRQPRPKKKAVPERVEPIFSAKALRAEAREAAAAAAQRKAERKAERQRNKSPKRRSRSRSRSASRSASSDGVSESGRAEEERERAQEEEEERLRKEQDERWKAAQQEREARQKEEMRIAEEKRLKDQQRHKERKKRLKGAFATGDSDEEDEEEKRQRELAERFKRQARSEALSVAAVSTVAIQRPEASSASTVPGRESFGGMELPAPGSGPADAISIRAQLADPSASRNFTAGEVAEKYKLLQEMKRKYRRSEFGGGVQEPKEKTTRSWRSRSRSRDRRKRSASRSKYDSVWIRPGGK